MSFRLKSECAHLYDIFGVADGGVFRFVTDFGVILSNLYDKKNIERISRECVARTSRLPAM